MMTIPVPPRRKPIPIGVKLHAALLLLGYTDEEITNGGIEWDHCPALALRFFNEETGELEPAANDPRFIRPIRTANHATKTFGPGGEKRVTTAGSDIHAIAKAKRQSRETEEFRRRLLAKDAGEPIPTTGKRRAKIPSRPFPKREKGLSR